MTRYSPEWKVELQVKQITYRIHTQLQYNVVTGQRGRINVLCIGAYPGFVGPEAHTIFEAL